MILARPDPGLGSDLGGGEDRMFGSLYIEMEGV